MTDFALLTPGEFVFSRQGLSRLDGARLLVALSSAQDKAALVSAALARKGLSGITEKYRTQIEALWEDANKISLSHLNLVMKNNPKKSKDDILKRPDIQSAMRTPYVKAAKESERLLRAAWAEAEAETVQKVKGELKLIKEDWQGYELSTDLLDALVADLHKNADAMRSRYREVLLDERATSSLKQRLESLTNDSRNRAGFSLHQAVWGVASLIRDSAASLAGLGKMWVAVLDDRTCSHCKGLHGAILKPTQQFTSTVNGKKLKTYQGVLYGPPAHPRCRCIIAIVKSN